MSFVISFHQSLYIDVMRVEVISFPENLFVPVGRSVFLSFAVRLIIQWRWAERKGNIRSPNDSRLTTLSSASPAVLFCHVITTHSEYGS